MYFTDFVVPSANLTDLIETPLPALDSLRPERSKYVSPTTCLFSPAATVSIPLGSVVNTVSRSPQKRDFFVAPIAA